MNSIIAIQFKLQPYFQSLNLLLTIDCKINYLQMEDTRQEESQLSLLLKDQYIEATGLANVPENEHN